MGAGEVEDSALIYGVASVSASRSRQKSDGSKASTRDSSAWISSSSPAISSVSIVEARQVRRHWGRDTVKIRIRIHFGQSLALSFSIFLPQECPSDINRFVTLFQRQRAWDDGDMR